jgi:metal-dependent hydrolase (beta-lactamase superfamily II)
MKVGDYDIDIVVQGYPGKTVCHGGLGWSSVVLVRAHGRIALVDTGGFNMRGMLLKRFAERGLKPADVTDILLTHSHYDHSVNWTLFRHARIVIGADELAWSLDVPWGETPVPELYVRELKDWKTVHKAKEGEEVFPGITAYLAPGHFHRRCGQESRRAGVGHHRHDLRSGYQQSLDRHDLEDLARASRHRAGARSRHADDSGERRDELYR